MMKPRSLTHFLIFCGSFLLCSAVVASQSPVLKFDKSPIPSHEKERHSYAKAIRAISPSVVQVIAHKIEQVKSGGLTISGRSGTTIKSPRYQSTRGDGSGVLLTPDGYILTNFHQVDEADWISVILASENREYEAKLIGVDKRTDLAVLKISGKEFPVATIGDSNHLEVGDVVIAVGNPFGIGQTSTLGIVSAIGRSDLPMARHVDLANFIQTDAAINPGNSGGALIDSRGRLVGINAALLNPDGISSSGIGFAIPINQAQDVLQQIIKNGTVHRGYMGLSIQKITPALADYFRLDEAKGAFVTNVFPDTPAAQAGIKEEDIIIQANGVDILSNSHFRSIVSSTKPGESLDLILNRSGDNVLVAIMPQQHSDLAKKFLGDAPLNGIKQTNFFTKFLLDGVGISELDNVWKKQLRIPNQINSGVVLSRVDPDSPMGQSNIEAGSVVLRVNRKEIRSVKDILEVHRRDPQRNYLIRYWNQGRYHYKVVNTSSF